MDFKKFVTAIIIMAVLSIKSFGQTQHLDSLEITNIINESKAHFINDAMPKYILKYLKKKTGRKFALKKLVHEKEPLNFDRYGRYFVYSSGDSNSFILCYISVEYAFNTHVLIFRLLNKNQIISDDNIITADHSSIADLRMMTGQPDFRLIRSTHY